MSKILLARIEDKANSGELKDIVNSNYSFTGVLRELGYSGKGQYISIVRDRLIELQISTKHFTPNGTPPATKISKSCINCGSSFTVFNRPSELVQETCSVGCANSVYRSNKSISGRSTYRKRALDYYGYKCSSCGVEDARVLQVHHVDKNRDNNSIGNLKVLCANCHLIEHNNDDQN